MRCWVLVCVGCGRIAFDSGAPDAPSNDAVSIDAASQCVTTFDGDSLPVDMVKEGTGAVIVKNGRLRLVISGVMGVDVVVSAAAPSSHVGRATAVQVVQPSSVASASTTLGWHEANGKLMTHLEMDGVSLKYNSFDLTNDTYTEYRAVPYDPVAHAWWRLREEAGKVLAEVSSDGSSWTVFSTLPFELDTSSIRWDLGLGSYVASIGEAAASFDNLVECQ